MGLKTGTPLCDHHMSTLVHTTKSSTHPQLLMHTEPHQQWDAPTMRASRGKHCDRSELDVVWSNGGSPQVHEVTVVTRLAMKCDVQSQWNMNHT